MSKVHVQNPVFDFVPPDLVTLFISNMYVCVLVCMYIYTRICQKDNKLVMAPMNSRFTLKFLVERH